METLSWHCNDDTPFDLEYQLIIIYNNNIIIMINNYSDKEKKDYTKDEIDLIL